MEVNMNEIMNSILLVLVGTFFGIIIFIIINYIRGIGINRKADLMLEKAKKEADKIKRDYLLEAKEEAHKIKMDNEKKQKIEYLLVKLVWIVGIKLYKIVNKC